MISENSFEQPSNPIQLLERRLERSIDGEVMGWWQHRGIL
jgi:hypothetical protein